MSTYPVIAAATVEQIPEIVHPDHRRRGIATSLVHAAEKHLHAKGAARVALIVVAHETPALAFWTAAGYTRQPDRTRFARDLAADDAS